MKKKFFVVAAVSLAIAMGFTGCSGVADLFGGGSDKTDKEADGDSTATPDPEELLKNLVPMEERREALLKDIDKLVVLGEYKGVEVDVTKIEITDEEVEARIQTELAQAGEPEHITEGTVADGDILNIDYVGKIDGKEFDGGSGTDQTCNIGSNSFIPGFEDALIGATIGETTDINVTFPEDYNEELGGKDAVFTVTINYKHGENVPAELTDAWVKDQAISEVETVDDYREYIRDTLNTEALSAQQQEIYSALMDKIIASSEIKGLSEDLDKEQMIEDEISSIEQYAQQNSMTAEDLVSQYMGQSLEEYREALGKDVDNYFNRIMIYRAVMQAENLQVTQDEYEEAVLGYSPQYAQYGEKSEADFIKNNSGDIYDGLLNSKAENFLLENVKTNEVEAPATEAPETEAPETEETE